MRGGGLMTCRVSVRGCSSTLEPVTGPDRFAGIVLRHWTPDTLAPVRLAQPSSGSSGEGKGGRREGGEGRGEGERRGIGEGGRDTERIGSAQSSASYRTPIDS